MANSEEVSDTNKDSKINVPDSKDPKQARDGNILSEIIRVSSSKQTILTILIFKKYSKPNLYFFREFFPVEIYHKSKLICHFDLEKFLFSEFSD